MHKNLLDNMIQNVLCAMNKEMSNQKWDGKKNLGKPGLVSDHGEATIHQTLEHRNTLALFVGKINLSSQGVPYNTLHCLILL